MLTNTNRFGQEHEEGSPSKSPPIKKSKQSQDSGTATGRPAKSAPRTSRAKPRKTKVPEIQIDWSKGASTNGVGDAQDLKAEEFTGGPCGLLKRPSLVSNNVLFFFMLVFSRQVMELVCGYTNENAEDDPPGGELEWYPLEVEEFKAFLGCIVYMGFVKLPARYLYLSKYSSLRVPFVADTFTKTRFELILRYLHLSSKPWGVSPGLHITYVLVHCNV